MMIHNLIKYIVQTRLRLWDIKITNFCYFYISQTKSILDKIFYKIVYHHIIYMCDFWVNLDNFFAVIYTGFHEGCEDFFFAPIEVIKKLWHVLQPLIYMELLTT